MNQMLQISVSKQIIVISIDWKLLSLLFITLREMFEEKRGNSTNITNFNRMKLPCSWTNTNDCV